MSPFKRFAIAFVVTAAAMIAGLAGGNDVGWGTLVVAAAGAPVTALFLAIAVAGPGGERRRLTASAIIGGTLVPVLVIMAAGVLTAAVLAVVTPFADAFKAGLGEAGAGGVPERLLTGWALFVFVEAAIVAPLAEETLKPLGALMRRPRSRHEAFLFGAAAGAGFAAVENLLYASTGLAVSGVGWLPVALIRSAGAGLHLFGASLISLAWYERRTRPDRPLVGLAAAWSTAIGAHALWNGLIVVANVAFASDGIQAGTNASIRWGGALLVMLAALGAMALVALVLVARSVRSGRPVMVTEPLRALARPVGITGWSVAVVTLLIPVAVAVAVFPSVVSL